MRTCVLFLVCCCIFFSPNNGEASAVDALNYLNQLRSAAGMSPLRMDAQLSKAAQAHADYLRLNHYSGHGEQDNMQGFTGQSPSERAIAAGFPSRHVSENIHYQYGSLQQTQGLSGQQAVDGLMTAIYHRFGFLSFDIDLLGIGYSADASNHVTVFVMGNRAEAKACQASGFASSSGSFYTQVCTESGKKIAATRWEQAKQDVETVQRPWVVWPYPDARNIAPAFSNESPDPLPDMKISGNPVSLNINPAYADSVKLSNFQLTDQQGRVLTTRMLDQSRDPNSMLNSRQFVWFPLQRLQWNARYTATVNMVLNGKKEHLVWSFHTRDLGVPLYTIRQNGQALHLSDSSRSFAIYIPPADNTPALIRSFSSSYHNVGRLDGRLYDSNTFIFHVSKPVAGGYVHVQTNTGFNFKLTF